MCWEDIKIGRKTKLTELIIPIPTGVSTQILQRNNKRISLVIGSGIGSIIMLGLRKSTPLATQGIPTFQSGVPIYLNLRDHGQLVCNEFFAFTAGAADVITIWETVLLEDGPEH